ncbi:hypothetical protein [Siccirubricoccus phaeus]|uniref:hypothetical protein n=1 Tax=Siccirubricoccus phaeus TaxID=2595053 RepID=UPI0011F2877E|nr:hypothetical protein [Siccirubricoccus phaeus]
MMQPDAVAVLVLPGDQPLRVRHGEIAGLRDVMRHRIHMRLEADTGGHGGADRCGAAGDPGAAMHLDSGTQARKLGELRVVVRRGTPARPG